MYETAHEDTNEFAKFAVAEKEVRANHFALDPVAVEFRRLACVEFPCVDVVDHQSRRRRFFPRRRRRIAYNVQFFHAISKFFKCSFIRLF